VGENDLSSHLATWLVVGVTDSGITEVTQTTSTYAPKLSPFNNPICMAATAYVESLECCSPNTLQCAGPTLGWATGQDRLGRPSSLREGGHRSSGGAKRPCATRWPRHHHHTRRTVGLTLWRSAAARKGRPLQRLYGGRLSSPSAPHPTSLYNSEEKPQQGNNYPPARHNPARSPAVLAHTYRIGEENPESS
jgi:hypothetical protein